MIPHSNAVHKQLAACMTSRKQHMMLQESCENRKAAREPCPCAPRTIPAI